MIICTYSNYFEHDGSAVWILRVSLDQHLPFQPVASYLYPVLKIVCTVAKTSGPASKHEVAFTWGLGLLFQLTVS